MSIPSAHHRRRGRGRGVNLLYLPALALFAVFLVYPLIEGVQLSFTNWNGYGANRSFVGLDNYTRLLTDPNFQGALGSTAVYGIGSTLVQQALGLALAVALNQRIRGRGLARTVIYLPVLVSPIVMGTMYSLLFQYNNGSLNDIVVLLGGDRIAWLSEASTATGIIVAVNSLQFVGISMVIYLAGLQTIPRELEEAASLDGATGAQRFRAITLPLLQPAMATSVVLNLIGGLKLFDVIIVLTGGGPGYSTNSVSTLISKTYFDNQSAGYASAMGVVLFIGIALIALVANALLDRRRLDQA